MINQKPKGGTELQFDYLTRFVDSKLFDEVLICSSVREINRLHPSKVNILCYSKTYDT